MSLLQRLGLCLALLTASSTASSFSPSPPLLHLHRRPAALKTASFTRGGASDAPFDSGNSGAQLQSVSPPSVALGAENGSGNASSNMEQPDVEAPAANSNNNNRIETQANDHMGPKAAPPGFLRKAFPHVAWYRIPNILTYMRCIAIPLLMWLFYRPNSATGCGSLFAFASFTDWLDGYLARRWDITSAFGAFLDPVADKLMVSTSLVLLTGRYGKVIAIPTAVILAREISVSALREWMAQRGLRDSVKVGFQGKLKTAATMVSLTLLLLSGGADGSSVLSKLYQPSIVMLYLCALVTVTSGSVYFRAAAPVLLESI